MRLESIKNYVTHALLNQDKLNLRTDQIENAYKTPEIMKFIKAYSLINCWYNHQKSTVNFHLLSGRTWKIQFAVQNTLNKPVIISWNIDKEQKMAILQANKIQDFDLVSVVANHPRPVSITANIEDNNDSVYLNDKESLLLRYVQKADTRSLVIVTGWH